MSPERIAELRTIWHDFGMGTEVDELLDEIERLRSALVAAQTQLERSSPRAGETRHHVAAMDLVREALR